MSNNNILEQIKNKKLERMKNVRQFVKHHENNSAGNPIPFFKKTGTTLIAECKKASPSKGIFIGDYNPVDLASQYRTGGADALSILTEQDYFLGDNNHLIAVKSSNTLPVLRKDFIIDEVQLVESRIIGADAVLLIAALLSENELISMTKFARSLGLEVLIEAHNKDEVEKALNAGPTSIGINSRDLRDFSVNIDIVSDLIKIIPADCIVTAESGIHSVESVNILRAAGCRAFLIGEYFLKSVDRLQTVRAVKDRLDN